MVKTLKFFTYRPNTLNMNVQTFLFRVYYLFHGQTKTSCLTEEAVIRILYFYCPALSIIYSAGHITENFILYHDPHFLVPYSYCAKTPFNTGW